MGVGKKGGGGVPETDLIYKWSATFKSIGR